MKLKAFNEAGPAEAAATLRPCLDVERWVADVVSRRPYPSIDELIAAGESSAYPLTEAEVDSALAHHPRIGEGATGDSREADLSRTEQPDLDHGDHVRQRLRAGNRQYEDRFGRVFLIRAAGRDAEEILTALEQRLTHDPDTEITVVADELRQIAILRLKGAIAS